MTDKQVLLILEYLSRLNLSLLLIGSGIVAALAGNYFITVSTLIAIAILIVLSVLQTVAIVNEQRRHQ